MLPLQRKEIFLLILDSSLSLYRLDLPCALRIVTCVFRLRRGFGGQGI